MGRDPHSGSNPDSENLPFDPNDNELPSLNVTPEPEVKTEFYIVPIELYKDQPTESDLYMYYQGQYISYKSKGQSWTFQDTEKLNDFGVKELYVKFGSRKEHYQYLEEKLSKLLDNANTPIKKKAHLLYTLAEPVLSTIHTTPESADAIHAACGYARNCIKYLNDRGALPELIELSSKNLTEHAHALHVSSYSIALAKKLGYHSLEEVFALGMGALLHDIGKSKVDDRILNKPTSLDESEWKKMRLHPKIGEEILDHRQLVPILTKRIVAEHHERINGKGYPNGMKTFHLFSKIVGIADVFNALTSKRPYATAMKPFDALKEMIRMKNEFDAYLLEAFIEMLSK